MRCADAPHALNAAIMEVRRAVRTALDALPEPARRAPLLVACSGGADSLALALATVAVHGSIGVHVAVVDHGLQEGSAERAAATVALLAERGIAAQAHTVDVTGPGGTEAAARRARQTALRAARPHPDSPILLGHTLDDQAETVLLGLGRGSGARSLAGMRRWDPPWLRPLLDVRRALTRAACDGLPVWDDPHNVDPRFTRVRLRREVLPLLEDVLGGGVAEALARTATQLREDADALDAVATRLLSAATHTVGGTHTSPAMCADPTGFVRPSDRTGSTSADQPGSGATRAGADHPRAGATRAGADHPRAGATAADDTSAGQPGAGPSSAAPAELDVAALKDVPPALRRRVLRAWLDTEGVTGLTDAHLRAADALAARGPDRAGVAVPGGLELFRAHGRLGVRPVRWPSAR